MTEDRESMGNQLARFTGKMAVKTVCEGAV